MTTQTQKILNFMRKNAYHEYNSKTLSRILKIDKKKINVYLQRLLNKGFILKASKGFYKASADMTVVRHHQLSNPPTLLHGILLECTLISKITKEPLGTPAKCSFFTKELIKWLESHEFRFRDDNGAWFRYIWWQGRRVTFTIQNNGKLDIYVSCSSSPLDYPSFELLLSFFDGYFEEIAPFKDRRVVKLKEVGLAKDFKELRLDGVKSVSLKAFKNAYARIYYKDDQKITRVEHHLVLEMSLDEALRSLSVLTNPVNYTKELMNPKLDEKQDVT